MAKKPAASSAPAEWPIPLPLATNRDDGGKTMNYQVYACTRQITAKNGKGEDVIKNAMYGGNGTIYVANELSKGHNEFVLMPRAEYDRLTKGKK